MTTATLGRAGCARMGATPVSGTGGSHSTIPAGSEMRGASSSMVVSVDTSAAPPGRWSPDRAAARASGLDCILVACTDPPPEHDSLARAYGVDRADLDALDVRRWFVNRAGLAEEPCPVMTLGSDPVVLAPRLFSADLLAKRIEYLWLMG